MTPAVALQTLFDEDDARLLGTIARHQEIVSVGTEIDNQVIDTDSEQIYCVEATSLDDPDSVVFTAYFIVGEHPSFATAAEIWKPHRITADSEQTGTVTLSADNTTAIAVISTTPEGIATLSRAITGNASSVLLIRCSPPFDTRASDAMWLITGWTIRP